jgi:hypothetical protein
VTLRVPCGTVVAVIAAPCFTMVLEELCCIRCAAVGAPSCRNGVAAPFRLRLRGPVVEWCVLLALEARCEALGHR